MLSDRLQRIVESFSRRAQRYDAHAGLQKECAAMLASLLPSMEKPDVLEIGCGTGFVTAHLLEKYNGAFLITDAAPEMVAVTAQKFKHHDISFSVMDGQAPTTDKKFDLIVIGMAAQWFVNPIERLNNLRGLLKPGGKIFYSVPGAGSFMDWKNTLYELGIEDGLLVYPSWEGIIKTEKRILDYDRVEHFLKNLKDIGAHQPRENYVALHPAALRRACRLYNERYGGKVEWEIVYGCLQAAC